MAIRMSGLLSPNIGKMIFCLWAVPVGLVLVVLRVVCEGAPEVRAMNAEWNGGPWGRLTRPSALAKRSRMNSSAHFDIDFDIGLDGQELSPHLDG
ncbi:hypothetical protein [Streptomyces sp. NPDC002588]|uniref:hypothetical protein n=1 Tax=Streptomyces sp. NPDC002588 TaxID=3154419 RepID=UPI00332A204B